MTSRNAALPVARLGVALAARVLRKRCDRERYATEFLAELYGLEPAAQLRHTVGIVSQVVALRAALGASRSRGTAGEAAMRPTAGSRCLRCRYLHWHHWQEFSTDDGARYVACAVCRKERAWDTPHVGGWVA
jgi:hypothetical protein